MGRCLHLMIWCLTAILFVAADRTSASREEASGAPPFPAGGAGKPSEDTAETGLQPPGTPSLPAGPAALEQGPVPGLTAAGGVACGWPENRWAERSPEDVGMDPAALDRAIEYVMTSTGTEEDRAGIRTDGYVVVRHGCLVAEGYARGYAHDMRHLAWSVTKSLTNALYGVAVKEGLVTMSAPAADYYPPMNDTQHRPITLEHLMFMSSGMAWVEGYEASPLKSTVIAMLYTAGRDDMAAYVASQPVVFPPGTVWQYSSGTTNLLMGILKQVLGAERYARFPWDALFDPLGMRSAVLERDGSGTFVGSSYLFATPRDLARFGYLYLRDGVWKDRRILPEGWVAWSTRIAPAYRKLDPSRREKGLHPAGHWWVNRAAPADGLPSPFPGVPEDAFAALGHWGQSIVVVPSLDLVVVRTADDRDGTFELRRWLALVVEAVEPAPRR